MAVYKILNFLAGRPFFENMLFAFLLWYWDIFFSEKERINECMGIKKFEQVSKFKNSSKFCICRILALWILILGSLSVSVCECKCRTIFVFFYLTFYIMLWIFFVEWIYLEVSVVFFCILALQQAILVRFP